MVTTLPPAGDDHEHDRDDPDHEHEVARLVERIETMFRLGQGEVAIGHDTYALFRFWNAEDDYERLRPCAQEALERLEADGLIQFGMLSDSPDLEPCYVPTEMGEREFGSEWDGLLKGTDPGPW